MTERRVPELDGIRGLAILLVIYWHYVAAPRAAAPLGTLDHALYRVGILSWSGVDLFFILSGFLIGGILIDKQQAPEFFRPFYLRRFFRIIPLYMILCIGGTVAITAQTDWTSVLGRPMPIWVCLGFLEDFWLAHHGWDVYMAITWSLAVEEQFYILAPVIIRCVKRSLLLPTIVSLICASILARSALYLHFGGGWGTACYVLVYCRADTLLLGVLGAMIVRDHRLREKLSDNAWILGVAVGFSGAVVAVFFLKGWTMQTRPMSTIGYTCVGAFYLTLVLFGVIHFQGWWARILRTPLLRHLGKLAYCLYMIHTSTLAIMESVVHRVTGRVLPSWISATTGLLVALVISEVSWRFFESKMIRIGHTFSYGITRTGSQLAAAGGGGV